MKNLIKNTEERIAWYKTQLGNISRYKKDYIDEDISKEDYEWYKDYIRDQKSTNERFLKELVEEQTYLNQGLNPPFYYKKFKK